MRAGERREEDGEAFVLKCVPEDSIFGTVAAGGS